MRSPQPDAPDRLAFVTTRWIQILSARGESPEAQVALGQLCEAYWMPVFRFIRRNNSAEDAARDLTQEFFAQLLAHHGLDGAEQGKGRFRSYLLGAVKHFLADQQDRANAVKRGGGQEPVPLESITETTATLPIRDTAAPVSDSYFDRQWALNVIDRALNELAAEFASADKRGYFETLKPWLLGDVEPVSKSDAGCQLGLSEGALNVAIHRLRKQFRALVKAEIARTVAVPDQVQEELRYLVEVLSQAG